MQMNKQTDKSRWKEKKKQYFEYAYTGLWLVQIQLENEQRKKIITTKTTENQDSE